MRRIAARAEHPARVRRIVEPLRHPVRILALRRPVERVVARGRRALAVRAARQLAELRVVTERRRRRPRRRMRGRLARAVVGEAKVVTNDAPSGKRPVIDFQSKCR